MRVAFVAAHANPLPTTSDRVWSQSVHVAELARALGALGHEVVVLTRRDHPSRAPIEVLGRGAVVRHLDAGPPAPLTDPELLAHLDDFTMRLRGALDEETPDVVHAHWWASGRAALAAGWPLGLPLVQTFHGLATEVHRFDPARDTSAPERLTVEQTLVRRADHVIATSSAELFELLRLGADMSRVTIVPPGVDLERFRPTGPVELRPAEGRRVVAVGRLIEQRGFAEAIRALPALPGVELVIGGSPQKGSLADDPVARSLRALAHELGVAERVVLRGRVDGDDLPALIRSADAVVCVPWYEPSGSPPVEAMACGIPPVVSAVGAHTDLVVDGITGLHVRPGRPDELAAALRRLLGDAELRRTMGEAGRRRAVARYGWGRLAATTAEIYAGLVPAGKAGLTVS